MGKGGGGGGGVEVVGECGSRVWYYFDASS